MSQQLTKDSPEKKMSVIAKAEVYDNGCFINREISQFLFNVRVLEQALDESHPLLERLKFLIIFSSNLDEFFEVRIAELKRQLVFGPEVFGPDGLAPKTVLRRISELCHEHVDKQYRILNDTLLPALEAEKVCIIKRDNWDKKRKDWITRYFQREVAPLVSPIALDPAHPFPKLVNKSLNFIVNLKGKDAFGRESRLAIVPAPRSLPRLIKLPQYHDDKKDEFVLLSAVIHANIDSFFHGMKAQGCYQFRVTRNSDLYVNEDEVDDIAAEVRGKLFNRRYGHAVRIEVDKNCPQDLKSFLLAEYDLGESDLYEMSGPVNLTRLFALFDMLERPDLEYPDFSPELPEGFLNHKNMFDSVRSKDYLLFHPYSSFIPVLDLLRHAALDPAVTSIKQTLYRVGHDSEIVNILVDAARQGKEVTAVVELKARFDEQENLSLASRLQEAGAVVCYGVVGYKTHAKMMLILRKEAGRYCRYVHLGTGNYHVRNARVYTDYSLLTCNEDMCEDVHNIFQQLTGMGKTLPMKYLFNAPFTLKKNLIRLIEGEIDAAKEGKASQIIIKVNGLTERTIIEKLYSASKRGVKIDLIVRGACVLRPGVVGMSENIRVKSVVGRFLEHNRVYYFHNAEHQVYCASADLMERNLTKRIEVCFPILSSKLRKRVINDLKLFIGDEGQSWLLDDQGNYQLTRKRTNRKLAQQTLLDKHCQSAAPE